MIQQFKESDYEIVDFSKEADIYIINTCTVTSMSDKKSRQFLRQAKKNNKNSLVVAVGCYVQVAKENLEKINEIDLCIGTNEKKDVVKIVEKYFEENKSIKIDDVFKTKEFSDFGTVTYTEKTRAVIKVQDGCDRFCSYCIIPYARGRVRSRRPESVVEEIKSIANNGIKEVVITGIHVASYGKDFKEKYELIELLEEINKIEGIERIRLGSIEPLMITEDFINRSLKLEKLCHHFHLSLQSGSTETLKRMNRRYSIEEFKIIVDRIRNAYKDAILTTDIIVGFPGETEEEFEETYKNLKEIKFYKMHIFKYSIREGTKAAEMKNQVAPEKKEERSNKLLKLSDENEIKYLNEYIDKEIDVLFEDESDGFWKGHTSNYLVVRIVSNENLTNQLKKIKINKVIGLELEGIVTK